MKEEVKPSCAWFEALAERLAESEGQSVLWCPATGRLAYSPAMRWFEGMRQEQLSACVAPEYRARMAALRELAWANGRVGGFFRGKSPWPPHATVGAFAVFQRLPCPYRCHQCDKGGVLLSLSEVL